MVHKSEWYSKLAERCGHPGFVTLAEITKAERDEAEAIREWT